MQFLWIANQMMSGQKVQQVVGSLEQVGHYRARHYSVIPLGPRSGLIQWVEGAQPLFSLFKKWQLRQQQHLENAKKMETVSIPKGMDWRAIDSLSWEVRERLSEAQPRNLGQLSRIPGVTPAAVNVVAAWLSRHRRQAAS